MIRHGVGKTRVSTKLIGKGMAMLRVWSAGVASALFLTGLTGCETFSGNKDGQDSMSNSTMSSRSAFDTVSPLADRRFPDVPLPPGAREDLQRTYVYESGVIQIGRMIYMVKAPLNEVAQFYIQNAPRDGWVLDSVMQAEGALLLFTKPGKRLTVSIRDTGITKRGVELILHMTPVDGSPLGRSRDSLD